MKKRILLLGFIFLLGLDIISKKCAILYVPCLNYGSYPFGGVPIFSLKGVTCSLNYVVNTGAAWGLFSGYGEVLFILRVLIIFGLFFFAFKRPLLGLILTGAIGNVIDYCLYSHVIDFIHLTFWGYSFPIFNLADIFISLGVFSLLLLPKPREVQKV